MKSNITIRSIQEDNIDFVVQGIMAIQEHECALHDTRKDPDKNLCRQYFETVLNNSEQKQGDIFVICENDTPVGFIAFWINEDTVLLETDSSNRYGYISDIFVLEQKRKNGYANQLLNAAQEHFSKKSIQRIRICALAANTLAKSAYINAGFEPYEILFEKVVKS